jgi:DNA-binding PadR family transcriptional regulator
MRSAREGVATRSVSKVEVIVLGLLAEEPLYGYDLLERLRARSIGFWAEVGKASVYQTLRRLERRGLVTGHAQAGVRGPDRRVFRITRPGRTHLRRGLVERFGEPTPFETEAGLALGFLQLLSTTQVRRAFAAREQALRGLIERLRAERDRASANLSEPRSVSDAMLDRQEALARAELGWLAAFRDGRDG